ncbi:MAG: hypothetical protein ACRDKW_08915 [Actinomycetota bacterium]
MKRGAVLFLSCVFMVSAFMPSATASEAKALFNGDGSARALDLSIPLLNALPVVGSTLEGLTVGLTSALFSSDPKAQGAAIGNCGLLPAGLKLPALPVGLPCINDATELSSAPEGEPGDGVDKCASALSLGLIDLVTSCANSVSKIVDARPVSLNKGGVATLNLGLTDLGGLLGLNVTDTAGGLVNTVTGLLSGVLGTVQGLAPVPALDLQDAVKQVLDQLAGLSVAKLATIEAGLSATDVTNDGLITNVVSSAAGAKVGLLGLTNALSDGLIVIDVSLAKAIAQWNDTTGTATSSSTPAVATIKVKDLLNLVPGDYLTSAIDASLLNSLLAPLAGTILDSGIELASATPPQQGNNVVASTSGVALRLLRGLGESALGARDGGITLRLAAADVRVAGDIVKAAQVAPALPVTGGPTYLLLGAAALLGMGSPLLARKARKMRKAA